MYVLINYGPIHLLVKVNYVLHVFIGSIQQHVDLSITFRDLQVVCKYVI